MVSGSCQCPDGILEELFAGACRRPVWVTLIGNLLSLGVVMVYTGSDAGDHASAPQPSGSGSVPASVNVPGLVVAAVWAVGLVAGLVALTIGHLAVAAAALVVAVMAPWCRVAYIAHGQHRVCGETLRGTPAGETASFPTGWRGLRFSTR